MPNWYGDKLEIGMIKGGRGTLISFQKDVDVKTAFAATDEDGFQQRQLEVGAELQTPDVGKITHRKPGLKSAFH